MASKHKAKREPVRENPFELRDNVAAYLSTLTQADGVRLLIEAGVFTKKGKLAARYRPSPVAG